MATLTTTAKKTKTFFLGLVSIILITSSCSSLRNSNDFQFSTSSVKLNSDILVGPGECVLKKFQGTSVNNKFYLYWVFQSNSNQFIFEIESSTNGKNFKPCYFKQGAFSPGSSNLMLCMTDSVSKNNVVYYRIKAIPENYSLKKKNDKDYKDLYNASTIMVTKNKKTSGYMQDDSFPTGNFQAVNK
jgi:hypothetical protein